MSMDETDNSYAVGYKKTPEHTRFKKGQSGNPKGRPKAAKNVGIMLEEIFFRKIPITENGSKREVTMLEAILRQLVNKAAKGEMRSIDRVLKLLPMVQEARAATLSGNGQATDIDPTTGLELLETLADMFGSDAEDLFASIERRLGDDSAAS